MERHSGFYALLQLSPMPERLEAFNIGVLLAVPGLDFFEVRSAKAQPRLERFLGLTSARPHLQLLKEGFAQRLEQEYRSGGSLEVFAEKRANELRLTQLLPIATSNPQLTLAALFRELVGEEVVRERGKRVATILREAFTRERLIHHLDEKPETVAIPEAGVRISAPFGYQNGVYHLIDGIKVSKDQNLAMQETGRRAIEGGFLKKHYGDSPDAKRLIVVGDFSEQPMSFYDAVGELLEQNDVRLYRLDDLNPLIEDIRADVGGHTYRA